MEPLVIRGVRVPRFLYGTAWKEKQTAPLVALALRTGFRGIDTANQRRHYFEAAVGDAVAASGLDRDALFLQTKFTFRAGQDHRLPYDPAMDIATQVRQSFQSSLEHLHVTAIDSFILHGPSYRRGLVEDDWAAWREMERLCRDGHTRLIGVSNVSLEQLVALHDGASVKPSFVQNRCYASTGWDREVRAFCAANDVVYQGFSLLTANAPVLRSPTVERISERTARSPAQVVFRFALQVGMVPLTGTSSEAHMREDLAVDEFELTDDEVRLIERASTN